MSDKIKEGTAGGSVVGFQMPLGLQPKHAPRLAELTRMHEDLDGPLVMAYFKSLDDKQMASDVGALERGELDELADRMRESIVRSIVRKRVREVVRKKPGGGGYVLYSPNQGKKKKPKEVGTFPTKLGAKRAELARFPPRDPDKLASARKSVEKMTKSPKKASKEKPAPKKESVDALRRAVRHALAEGLFREERAESEWNDRLKKLSADALSSDKGLARFQKAIDKKTTEVLDDAFVAIARGVDKKKVKLKSFGIKKAADNRVYLAFSATMGNVEVAPIYVYLQGGTPKIEVSDQARAAMTKAPPDAIKLFRAELVTVQERVLDEMDELSKVVAARDKHMAKMTDDLDEMIAELNPVQMSLLKDLITKKYRKS